jgi:hypothetical protein
MQSCRAIVTQILNPKILLTSSDDHHSRARMQSGCAIVEGGIEEGVLELYWRQVRRLVNPPTVIQGFIGFQT